MLIRANANLEKIIIFTNGYPPTSIGGVELYTRQIAEGFHERGKNVIVVCRESSKCLEDYSLLHEQINGIEVYRIVNDFKELKDYNQFYENKNIDKICLEILRKHNPDIAVVNHLIGLSSNIPFILHQNKIPFLYYLHDFWNICDRINLVNAWSHLCSGPLKNDCYKCLTFGQSVSWKKQKLLYLIKIIFPYSLRKKFGFIKRIIKTSPHTPDDLITIKNRHTSFYQGSVLSNLLLVPSNFVKEIFVNNGYPDKLITVLPLGEEENHEIDLQLNYQQLDIKRITFGYIGHIIPIKGLEVLIRAFRMVDNQNIYLKVFGRDDIDIEYSKKIKLLSNNDKRIYFLGVFNPDNKNLVYNQIDILVIPSLAPETFSFVAREALARKIPIIASDVGVLPELVRHHENGYLFARGDFNELANIIRDIAHNPSILFSLNKKENKKMTKSKHIDFLLTILESVR